MRFEDERYVRLYTRDTVGWRMLPWQSKALLPLLMRKVDRAGILEVGDHGIEGLAAIVELPVDIVDAGLTGLLKSGTASMSGAVLVLPNFLEAQEAVSSDAQRKRDQRERALARVRLNEISDVTKRDSESQNVTSGHETGQKVTRGHARSREVTDGHSDPIRSEPSNISPSREPATLTPYVLGSMFDQETGRPNSGNLTALSSLVDRIRKHRELSKAERTDVEHAAAFVAGFKSIVGQWRAAGKPAPSLTVEKFDEHFAHVCDWVEGKFRIASTSTQSTVPPKRRNDLTALATGKVRE